MTDTVIAASIGGFVAAEEEWQWVECDYEGVWQRLQPKVGAEPLRAEILTSLTNGQVAKIPHEAGTLLSEMWPYLTRTVRSWNVKALDLATGEYVDVPSPMHGGIESLQSVPALITEWLVFMVKFARFRNRDLGKDSKSSDGTPSSQPAPILESSAQAKKSRKSQPSTT